MPYKPVLAVLTWRTPLLSCESKEGGERSRDALRVNFDRKLKLEFNETKVTSNTGKKLQLVAILRRFCLRFGEEFDISVKLRGPSCITKRLIRPEVVIWEISYNSAYLCRLR